MQPKYENMFCILKIICNSLVMLVIGMYGFQLSDQVLLGFIPV